MPTRVPASRKWDGSGTGELARDRAGRQETRLAEDCPDVITETPEGGIIAANALATESWEFRNPPPQRLNLPTSLSGRGGARYRRRRLQTSNAFRPSVGVALAKRSGSREIIGC